MTALPSVSFKIVPYDSREYKEALKLRAEILRQPLGLTFLIQDLEADKNHIHVVGLIENEVIVTGVLVPQGKTYKMQQVAVKPNYQGSGIATALLAFCEDYVLRQGASEIYCDARESAVPFYLKNGFKTEGEPFEKVTLPHITMRKVL